MVKLPDGEASLDGMIGAVPDSDKLWVTCHCRGVMLKNIGLLDGAGQYADDTNAAAAIIDSIATVLNENSSFLLNQ